MNVLALIACGVVRVLKTPGALRGHGRVSYAGFVMLFVALLLTVPQIYITVDSWLGGVNFAHIIVRAAVFGVASAMAVSLARVFAVYWIESFVLSWRGMLAVAISVLIEIFLISMQNSSPSSAGLPASSWAGSPRLAGVYFAVGVIYPALLASFLLVPTLRFIVKSHGAFVVRFAYGLMTVGMIGLIVMAISYSLSAITLINLVPEVLLLSWLSVISFCIGVVLHSGWGYVHRLRKSDQPEIETTTA